jgi:cytochrome c oxidase subunit 4
MDTWYPSVRFRANDATVTPIREKELGDWKKLTLDEKKLLYRYSFCQTLAEYEAPNGYWKVDWTMSLIVISFAVLYACFLQKFCK